jgi:hypothetical protein
VLGIFWPLAPERWKCPSAWAFRLVCLNETISASAVKTWVGLPFPLERPPSVLDFFKAPNEYFIGEEENKTTRDLCEVFPYRLMSESASDHFLDLEEEASKVSSTEEREVSPPEGGLSDVSIPEVIQSAELEELLSQENFPGDFERAYLHCPINEVSPEPKRARSPIRKRGQPVDEPADFPGVVRSRTATRSPSPCGFKSPTRGQPRTTAGRGAFQSPLRTRARGRSLREKEEFVRNAFLFLQDDIYPTTNKVGHAL